MSNLAEKFNIPPALFETIKKMNAEETEYQMKVKALMKKKGITSLGQLSPEEKKAFFNTLDAMHKAKNEEVEINEVKVGDKVHLGLKQKGGSGMRGTVHKIEGDTVHVNVGKEKFGDRIVKGSMKNVTKEEIELDEAIPKSTNYALVHSSSKKIIAKGNKAEMMKKMKELNAKEKNSHHLGMTNRGKVGDTFGEEVKLEEGKSGTGYELYHKDFSSAMQHAYDFAKKKYNIEIDPLEIDRNVAMGPRKPSSGKANAYRLLDKTGKKAIQVQVTNLDNKRYELNMYKEDLDLTEVAASKSLQKAHDDERKKRGLPDPDYYLKLAAQKKKEIEDMKKQDKKEETSPPFTPDKPKKNPGVVPGKRGVGPSVAKHLAKMAMKKQQEKKPVKEEQELNEDLMKLDPITNTLVAAAIGIGMTMYTLKYWFSPPEDLRKPIEKGLDKAEKAGNAKLYHSLAAKYHEDIAAYYQKKLDKLKSDPNAFYKKDSLKTGAKAGDMKRFEKVAQDEYLKYIKKAKEKAKMFSDREKSGAPIAKGTYYYESVKNVAEQTELNESHFKVGQRVECIKSGMKGTVVKKDTPEEGKYYTVKQDSGKMMKYAPDELKALSTNEAKEEGASKKKENEFHTKLDKLVHKTFGHSSDEKKMKKEEVEEAKDPQTSMKRAALSMSRAQEVVRHQKEISSIRRKREALRNSFDPVSTVLEAYKKSKMKKEATAKDNKKNFKSGDKLSGKTEPIEINPELKEQKT